MPQLDILLFSSQFFTGILFFWGFILFSRTILPFISFFVKLDEYLLYDSLETVEDLLSDEEIFYKFKNSRNNFVDFFKSHTNFFCKEIRVSSIFF